jgi:iron complex transport system substrate-binding protein
LYRRRAAQRYDRPVAAYPQRIVCLTEETTETLYRLGAGDRVVGISGYTMRPEGARQKPRVSSYTSARFDAIAALEPDLVLTFSDLQADITAELIRRGYSVVAFNQRTVAGILQMILMVGGLVGLTERAVHVCGNLEQCLLAMRMAGDLLPRRPRVFFEEWPDPLISGIGWVEELIAIAGGDPIFPRLRDGALARDRIVSADAVREAAPDAIIASWCGRRVRKDRIAARPGWADMPAVRDGHVYEIKSTYILQPGPAALTEGVRQIHALLCRTAGVPIEPSLAPEAPWDDGRPAGHASAQPAPDGPG